MTLICSICKQPFEWERPASSKGGQPPKLCGAYDKNDRWVPTLTCMNTRRRQYAKTRTPQYHKVQKSKKRRCTVKGCQRVTANGGQNYFLCDYHWHQLSKDCSSEYPEFIYEDSNFDDIHPDYSAAVDKHFWDLV